MLLFSNALRKRLVTSLVTLLCIVSAMFTALNSQPDEEFDDQNQAQGKTELTTRAPGGSALLSRPSNRVRAGASLRKRTQNQCITTRTSFERQSDTGELPEQKFSAPQERRSSSPQGRSPPSPFFHR